MQKGRRNQMLRRKSKEEMLSGKQEMVKKKIYYRNSHYIDFERHCYMLLLHLCRQQCFAQR